jgi:hypothetical protein
VPAPDSDRYVVARDGEPWCCFILRDGDGNFIGSTVEDWLASMVEASIERGLNQAERGDLLSIEDVLARLKPI